MTRHWLLGCALALGITPALAETPAYHVMRLGPRPAPEIASAKTMLYYAGPVISNVKAVAVIWSSHVNLTTQHQIGGFLHAIVNSTFVDVLKQYSTHRTGVNGRKGTDQTIGRGTYEGEFVITPKNTSLNLTNKQVQTELEAQIASGALPAADQNTLYLIYFPRNVHISLGNLHSCVQYGAYHISTSPKISATNLYYAVEPDCGGGFTSQTVASSHEFGEAITDKIPTPGTHPAYPQAWNTSGGSEIGDLCESYSATLTTSTTSYTVQELFDNAQNRCAVGNYTSP